MKSGQHWGKSPYMVKELSKAPRWVKHERRQDEVPWDGKGSPYTISTGDSPRSSYRPEAKEHSWELIHPGR